MSIAERISALLRAFSPWDGISLTYRQFAAELGDPITEAAIKKWPQRKKFPAGAARLIVSRARERDIGGVTLEWVLWGDGPGPETVPKATPLDGLEQPAAAEDSHRSEVFEAHGQLAAEIGRALQEDLSHNEFGQWSSVEVQHTVIWALKDLARRLRVLRFDMGSTFELTDRWAASVGLPIRPSSRLPDEGAA